MTDHKHRLAITNAEPAPEGLNGRAITITCQHDGCDHTHKTITLKTDTEIQTELDAYNEDDAA